MIPKYFRSATSRLALSYLAVIMSLSIAFSAVLFKVSVKELGEQLPPRSFYVGRFSAPEIFDDFFSQRITEGRHALISRLILLNVVVLLVGAIISYLLARRSLLPIEQAMESQSRFSSDASHELRTPLTAIRTKNEVALRKPGLTVKQAKEVIKSNLSEAIKLEKLSDGLLKLSSVDNHGLEKKPLALCDAAASAVNQIIESARAKNIKIKDNVPNILVAADSSSLSQALAILLENAIKYSNRGSTVLLEASQKGSYCLVRVKDEGIGIKPSELEHIFERFYRADSSRSRDGNNGYGLGLSIAKKIIEQHNGEIGVKSAPGKGSTFTIKLGLVNSSEQISKLKSA